MAEKEETKEAGLGQKLVFGILMAAASLFYYFIFLNWTLMEPIQNLPYPY